MAKRDCLNCKNCILKPTAGNNGITNTCKFDDRFRKLSPEELIYLISTKECDWFEKGTPERSNEVCYDD